MTTELRTVGDVIGGQAQQRSAAAAILRTDGRAVVTYGDLAASTQELAGRLRGAGIGRGEVVLVSLPSGPEMLTAILGTMTAAVSAPMNPAYTAAELAGLADDVDAAAVVILAGHGETAARLAAERQIPCLEIAEDGAVSPSAGGNLPLGDAPGADDIALLLHTSGTTARPKQVPLTHANLLAAASNVVRSLELGPSDRCLNVMPMFHSHGLLGAALSSLVAGGSIICAEAMDPRRFLGWASRLDATWYTAAPTIHRLVLEAPGDYRGFRFMRSASAPLPPQIAEALEERFGAPMIEVYGMTEAYQLAANPLPPGTRRLGSVGRPTGTEIRIADAAGESLPDGDEGEVLVRGPSVFRGYSHPREANATAFFDDWFRTGDLGTLSKEGILTITGRVKEQINRGGEKIAPREVDEALLDHPDIVEAMTFPIPDDQLGEDVGAAVVVRAGAAVDAVALRRFLGQRLAPFKVPRSIVVVEALPKSATGKLQRVNFARDNPALIPPKPQRAPAAAPAENEPLEHRLALLWQELLDLRDPPVGSDRFFELGGTSLLAMKLISEVEARFGVDLPVIDVAEVPTLRELAERIRLRGENTEGSENRSLLRPYRVQSAARAVVLVPGAWGMGVGLNLIGDALGDTDVYLFDYPGHDGSDRPLRTIDQLAERLVGELAGVASPGLVLYGNSMGSWVVLEAAYKLRELGRPPELVGLGDMYHPAVALTQPSLRPSVPRRLWNRTRRLLRSVPVRRGSHDVPLSAAERRQRDVYDASLAAQRAYRCDRRYPGDVLLVVADERAERIGGDLGWGATIDGELRVRRVPGSHSDMHRDQASKIARYLTEALQQLP